MTALYGELNKLDSPSDKDLFSDCTIVAGGEIIPAHRATLARSAYFSAAFTSGFKEGHDKRIELPEPAAATRFLLSFLYESEKKFEVYRAQLNELSFSDLLELREAADKYCIYPVAKRADELLVNMTRAFDSRSWFFGQRPALATEQNLCEMIETLYAEDDDIRDRLKLSLIEDALSWGDPIPVQGWIFLTQEYPDFIRDFVKWNMKACSEDYVYPETGLCLTCLGLLEVDLTTEIATETCQGCGEVDFPTSFSFYFSLYDSQDETGQSSRTKADRVWWTEKAVQVFQAGARDRYNEQGLRNPLADIWSR